MILIFSGEGVSDLGRCDNAQASCTGADVRFGPLALVVDAIAAEHLGYSVVDVTPDACTYISEHALFQRAAEAKGQRRTLLAGKKREQETGYFYLNAWTLAEMAKQIEVESGDRSVTIFFRDSDGTNSSPATLWESKYRSMHAGFASAEYDRGVPMLPKPKSEAWFLCAVKNNPYAHCLVLEDRSGNDASPNALKTELAESLGQAATSTALHEWLASNSFEFRRIAAQMPSFARFYEDLGVALQSAVRR